MAIGVFFVAWRYAVQTNGGITINRRTEGLTISQAIDGFVKYKVVEGLSERTLESHLDHLKRFQQHIRNILIFELSAAEVEDFLYFLRADYRPKLLNGQ